jgi:hypothetical protein
METKRRQSIRPNRNTSSTELLLWWHMRSLSPVKDGLNARHCHRSPTRKPSNSQLTVILGAPNREIRSHATALGPRRLGNRCSIP